MWFKFLLGMLISGQAFGWRLTQDFNNGFYWQSLPVSITVIDANPTRKAKLEYLSKEAIREWERGANLNLWSPINEGTANIIRWSENFQAETNMDPNSVLAVAIRYTSGAYFAKTEIVINGNHFLNQNDVHLLTTLTHELGHTMGLDHSEDFEAIMAPTLQTTFQGISFDDRNGIKEAHKETLHRQQTGFISPLAYEKETTSEPLSCGTVAASSATPAGTFLSLAMGILIGFVRKIISWFKSRP